MTTTTELIKLLQDNEKGGISHRSRQISLTVNGRYIPDPQITISSTGDGIVGPEIDLNVDGEWFEHEADEIDEVLDKIKRDIFNACCDTYYMPVNKLGCEKIFEIIDKYKSESEVKDESI